MDGRELRELARHYKIAEDSFAYFLLATMAEAEARSRLLWDNFLELRDILKSRDAGVVASDLISRLRAFEQDLQVIRNDYRDLCNRLFDEVLSRVDRDFFNRHINRFYNFLSLQFVLLCVAIFAFFLMVGIGIGRQIVLNQVENIQGLVSSREVRRALKFVEENPHVFNCSGPGWEVQNGFCIPRPQNNRVRGWKLVD